MKNFVRCSAVAAALFIGAGLVACSGGTPAPSSSTPSASTAPMARNLGGTLIWRPDVVKASDGQCANPSNIAAGGAALTVTVKADVTYVDLQMPQQLQDLTGLQAGDDFVAIPASMFEAHVSTIELGNQFDKRGANDVHACWK